MDIGKQITAQYETLKTQRTQLDQQWGSAYRYTNPLRGQGFFNVEQGMLDQLSTAQSYEARIFDSTAAESVQLLASALVSGLTPPNTQWFSFEVEKEVNFKPSQESKTYTETSAKKLHSAIHTSNYDSQILEFNTDIATAGMGAMFIDSQVDEDTGVPSLHFETVPLYTLYVQSLHDKEVIDTVYRLVAMTASEAVKKFGVNKLPKKIQEHYKKDPYSEKQFEFVHTVRPRIKKNGKQAKGLRKQTMPFESVYVCKASKQVVLTDGYHEFPYIIPRWFKIAGTDYATGPLREALPNVKTLNKVVEMILQNGEMAIAGTFVATDDGILNPNTVRIGPRRVIVVADTNNIKPLATGGNFQIAFAEVERLQKQVKSVMMSDMLQPYEKQNMTATEVQTRGQLIRKIMSPRFGRLQAEQLDPMLARCFGLMSRAGMFGTSPKELKGRIFKPVYQSPQARAQKLEEVSAIEQYSAALLQLSQLYPDVRDKMDGDEAAERIGEAYGVPSDLIVEEKAVQKLRKDRQDNLQAQQQAEQQAGTQAPQ